MHKLVQVKLGKYELNQQYISVSKSCHEIVLVFCSCCWVKLGKCYTGSLCIIPYNCIWIIDDLNQNFNLKNYMNLEFKNSI